MVFFFYIRRRAYNAHLSFVGRCRAHSTYTRFILYFTIEMKNLAHMINDDDGLELLCGKNLEIPPIFPFFFPFTYAYEIRSWMKITHLLMTMTWYRYLEYYKCILVSTRYLDLFSRYTGTESLYLGWHTNT